MRGDLKPRRYWASSDCGRFRTLSVTGKQREEGMRWLILGAVLSAVADPALAAEFMLSSTEVKSGSPMALAQALTACKGQNISPALSWSGEPSGTQSFAVTMYDPDARGGSGWWHWTVFNIPATVPEPTAIGTGPVSASFRPPHRTRQLR